MPVTPHTRTVETQRHTDGGRGAGVWRTGRQQREPAGGPDAASGSGATVCVTGTLCDGDVVLRRSGTRLGLSTPSGPGAPAPPHPSQPPPQALTPAPPGGCEGLQGPVSAWYPSLFVPSCPHLPPPTPNLSGPKCPFSLWSWGLPPSPFPQGCQWEGGAAGRGKGEQEGGRRWGTRRGRGAKAETIRWARVCWPHPSRAHAPRASTSP